MTWATGLILWILGGLAVMWIYAAIVDGGKRGFTQGDEVAEAKRRTVRKAKQLSGEF
jgi:hypothetical protein